jgi:hypothetical protein
MNDAKDEIVSDVSQDLTAVMNDIAEVLQKRYPDLDTCTPQLYSLRLDLMLRAMTGSMAVIASMALRFHGPDYKDATIEAINKMLSAGIDIHLQSLDDIEATRQ